MSLSTVTLGPNSLSIEHQCNNVSISSKHYCSFQSTTLLEQSVAHAQHRVS